MAFLDLLAPSPFIPLQDVVYFTMLTFFRFIKYSHFTQMVSQFSRWTARVRNARTANRFSHNLILTMYVAWPDPVEVWLKSERGGWLLTWVAESISGLSRKYLAMPKIFCTNAADKTETHDFPRILSAVTSYSVRDYHLFKGVLFTLCIATFNIHKFHVLPTECICVLCGSEKKQRLFPYTALSDWFV